MTVCTITTLHMEILYFNTIYASLCELKQHAHSLCTKYFVMLWVYFIFHCFKSQFILTFLCFECFSSIFLYCVYIVHFGQIFYLYTLFSCNQQLLRSLCRLVGWLVGPQKFPILWRPQFSP